MAVNNDGTIYGVYLHVGVLPGYDYYYHNIPQSYLLPLLFLGMGTNEEINNPAGGTQSINIAENSNETRVYKLSVPSLKLSDRIPSIQSDFADFILCIAFFNMCNNNNMGMSVCTIIIIIIKISITMCSDILSISN